MVIGEKRRAAALLNSGGAGNCVEMDFNDYPAFRKVGLTADGFAELMEQFKEEITAMMAALNG